MSATQSFDNIYENKSCLPGNCEYLELNNTPLLNKMIAEQNRHKIELLQWSTLVILDLHEHAGLYSSYQVQDILGQSCIDKTVCINALSHSIPDNQTVYRLRLIQGKLRAIYISEVAVRGLCIWQGAMHSP